MRHAGLCRPGTSGPLVPTMHDPQDRLDLHGPAAAAAGMAPRSLDPHGPPEAGDDVRSARPGGRFLSVWYTCCHAYGRLTRNAAGTRYEGGCPRCGRRTSATIGPGGTARRMFEAR